jgi:predicted house-cleaning NTP pyrophosphatase (Maf/HAM1 superfamily)
MKKYGFFKKIKMFLEYRKSIKKIENVLRNELNIKVDRACRLYTVINIPEENFEQPYNFRKSDIDSISEKFIKEYFAKLQPILNNAGLIEMYEVYDIEKVGKYSYLPIVGFSLFKTHEVFKRILLRWIPITLLLSLISFSLYYIF